MNDLYILEPSVEAIQEVAQVHAQLDPPTEPLVLSMSATDLVHLVHLHGYEPCGE